MFTNAENLIVKDDTFIKRVLDYVRLRKPFKYGYSNIFDYLLKLKCLRLRSKDNLTYYDKGK